MKLGHGISLQSLRSERRFCIYKSLSGMSEKRRGCVCLFSVQEYLLSTSDEKEENVMTTGTLSGTTPDSKTAREGRELKSSLISPPGGPPPPPIKGSGMSGDPPGRDNLLRIAIAHLQGFLSIFPELITSYPTLKVTEIFEVLVRGFLTQLLDEARKLEITQGVVESLGDFVSPSFEAEMFKRFADERAKAAEAGPLKISQHAPSAQLDAAAITEMFRGLNPPSGAELPLEILGYLPDPAEEKPPEDEEG